MSKHRLVDLDQAIEEINDLVCSMSVCLNRSEYEGMKNMKRRILNVLEDLPSAQPEIIYCSECRYAFYKDGKIWVCGHSNHNAWNIRDDQFCGYAVRKEDG